MRQPGGPDPSNASRYDQDTIIQCNHEKGLIIKLKQWPGLRRHICNYKNKEFIMTISCILNETFKVISNF